MEFFIIFVILIIFIQFILPNIIVLIYEKLCKYWIIKNQKSYKKLSKKKILLYKRIYNNFLWWIFFLFISYIFVSFYGLQLLQDIFFKDENTILFIWMWSGISWWIFIISFFIIPFSLASIIYNILNIKYPNFRNIEIYTQGIVLETKITDLKAIKYGTIILILGLLSYLLPLNDYKRISNKWLEISKYFNTDYYKLSEIKSLNIEMLSKNEWYINSSFKINLDNKSIEVFNYDVINYASENEYENLIEFFKKNDIEVNINIDNNIKNILDIDKSKNIMTRKIYNLIKN